jgi:DNA-binding LacI/PurR family transcriptional regulator
MTTIYDIARAMGVSQTTVANALKGKGNVSEVTRRKIMQYAREVGYRPNIVASSLAQRKTFTLGFILPTIANPFYPEIAEEIERVARQHNYQVVLCNTHGDMSLGRQHLERLVSRWVDGVIAMGISMSIADLREQYHLDLPIVLCDWQENEAPEDIPQVSIDFRQAGVLAGKHLLSLGHKHMAIIVDEPLQTLRREGFSSVLRQAGLTMAPEMIQQGDSTLLSGYTAAMRLLSLPLPPTAIFATNDWMAIGAIKAAHDMGVLVPHELSIVGLDDIVVSAHIYPPLTTIAIPKQELARTATDLLLQQIAGHTDVAPLVLVPPSLLIRESTAAVPVLQDEPAHQRSPEAG